MGGLLANVVTLVVGLAWPVAVLLVVWLLRREVQAAFWRIEGVSFQAAPSSHLTDFNMVPFKDKLKDDEIRTIVAFIRSLERRK